jgi:serine/threonine protein kinase
VAWVPAHNRRHSVIPRVTSRHGACDDAPLAFMGKHADPREHRRGGADDADTIRDAPTTRIGRVTPLPRFPKLTDVASRPWACPTCRALYRGGMVHCPRDGARLAEAVEDPLIGQIFAGRYLIEDTIAEGGMGRVYRARHTRLDRRFAIKVLHPELSMQESTVLRFHREATAISRLSHHNVVRVVDFGELDDGLLYLVMELVDGRSLRDIIREDGPLPADRILELLGQICDGLAHAHRHGLVHRDFKPENVVVERHVDGEHARIVDFGIAADVAAQRITTDGLVLGTPSYMAPEQAVGRFVDHRADLYALGVVLYEMVTGVQPFAGSPGLVMQMHALEPPPPMAERAPGVVVDPLLEALARRLMAKRPEDRIETAREVRRLVKLATSRRGLALAALGVVARTESELPTQPATRCTAPAPGAEPPVVVAVTPPAATPRRRRGPPPWLFAAVAVPAAIVVALRLADPGPIDVPVTPSLDMSPLASTLPVDSARILPALPADVEMEQPAATRPESGRPGEAAPVPRRAEREPERRRERERAPRRMAAAAPEPPAELPAASLSERYRDLGARLQRLVERRGEPATSTLRARYFAIRINDGLRDPAEAERIARELAALGRDIDGALR